MLPYSVPIEELDKGIAQLVIDLNRVPGIDTFNSGEGEVTPQYKFRPTKDGGVRARFAAEHAPLLADIRAYCDTHPEVELQDERFPHGMHFLRGKFPPFLRRLGEPLIDAEDPAQFGAYIAAAHERHAVLRARMQDIDGIVQCYIRRTYGKEPEEMPYRGPAPIDWKLTYPLLTPGFRPQAHLRNAVQWLALRL